ncbi:MAG: tetratricopeptide repeat protein [Xanthomonadales bacterium]|nr:tetratricopeptide repeat protein [Xanthomonadales bacterium]
MTDLFPSTRRFMVCLLALALSFLLVSCASRTPAPVEDREVEKRVRTPARQDSEGVQVRPLQNPAVIQLTDEARRAEHAGDFDQAAVLLERALRIQPRDPEILQHMAEVQLSKEDYEQALSFAIRSYDIGPRVGEICARNWRTIGVAKEHLDDPAGAREAEQRSGQCMNTRPAGF